jgi:hypothetical protein
MNIILFVMTEGFQAAVSARIAGNGGAYTAQAPALRACRRGDVIGKPGGYQHRTLAAKAVKGFRPAVFSGIAGGCRDYIFAMSSICR